MSKDFKPYTSYTEEDYLEDKRFRNWVLQPTSEMEGWWQALFTHYPEQQKVAERARVLLLEMKDYFQPTDLESKSLDESFIAALKEQMEDANHTKVIHMNRRKLLQRFAIAASIVFMFGTVLWFWLIKPQQMQVIATNYGEWKTQTLPDGSEVKLNANSEIKFATNWQMGEDRKVWLMGEAFFEVSKDPQRAKFTVVTEDLEVEVLGTAFNVHSRGKQTGVFLKEGKVRLDMGKEERLMVPGEFIAYSAHGKKIIEYKKSLVETHTSWKEGSLIMQDEKVEKIFGKIAEIYGYKIEMASQELLGQQKTIAIPMDKIEISIPILEKVLGVEIELKENLLIVK